MSSLSMPMAITPAKKELGWVGKIEGTMTTGKIKNITVYYLHTHFIKSFVS